jgi:hypothetical protein
MHQGDLQDDRGGKLPPLERPAPTHPPPLHGTPSLRSYPNPAHQLPNLAREPSAAYQVAPRTSLQSSSGGGLSANRGPS